MPLPLPSTLLKTSGEGSSVRIHNSLEPYLPRCEEVAPPYSPGAASVRPAGSGVHSSAPYMPEAERGSDFHLNFSPAFPVVRRHLPTQNTQMQLKNHCQSKSQENLHLNRKRHQQKPTPRQMLGA